VEKSKEVIGAAFERWPIERLHWRGPGERQHAVLWLVRQVCRAGDETTGVLLHRRGDMFDEIRAFLTQVSRD